MSLIATSAQSLLRQSWGAPSQLNSLTPDQLRTMLQMAQAEGQSQVEGWVLDVMRSKGVRASRSKQALRMESKMDSRDWVEKAMALVLAGGIAAGMWGATLPVVDQTFSETSQPAVTQVYEHREDVTSQFQSEIQVMRNVAQGIDGAYPNAKVGPIYSVSQVSDGCPSFDACSYPDGSIEIVLSGKPMADSVTIAHEISHNLTRPPGASSRSFEESHNGLFCEVFYAGYSAITGYERAPSSMCP